LVGLRYLKYVSLVILFVVFVIAWWLFVDSSYRMGVRDTGISPTDLIMGLMMDPTTRVSSYILAAIIMWTLMMLAMMLPAAVPLILIFRKIYRTDNLEGDSLRLAFGFLTVWILFSTAAAMVQWALHQNGLLGGKHFAVNKGLAGAIFFGAGLYQFSPIKDACLSRCRSPVSFLVEHWDPVTGSAFRIGFHHGLFCLGCCWVLMLLMFAGGVMSVLTMAVISILILLERTLPGGRWIRFLPGFSLLGIGTYVWLYGGG